MTSLPLCSLFMALPLGFSADEFLMSVGKIKCEHGKYTLGLPFLDVWTHANEFAIAASKSRPAEGQRSQALLKACTKVLLAVNDLAELAPRGALPSGSSSKSRDLASSPKTTTPSAAVAAPCLALVPYNEKTQAPRTPLTTAGA